MKAVNGVAVLHRHLDATLHLQPQNIYRLLLVIQLQLQCLSVYVQGLALALSLFQLGKMLEKSVMLSFNEPL